MSRDGSQVQVRARLRIACPTCATLRAEIRRLKAQHQSHLAATRAEAIRRYVAGDPARLVAAELGVANSTVSKWVQRAKVSRPRRRNERHDAAVKAAVAAVRGGFTMKAAARNYDLGYATLRRHCEKAGVVSSWVADRSQAKGSTARGRNSSSTTRHPRATEHL